MSFDLPERLRRNIGVRLGLWYAFIFAVSGVGLLALAYYLVAGAIGQKDREILEARLREYAAIYGGGGLSALRATLDQEGDSRQSYFVRLLNGGDEVAFANVPPEWVTFHDVSDRLGYRRHVGVTIRVPKDAERDFLIVSAALRDNSLLQVGRSTDSRAGVLFPLRRNFVVAGSAAILLGFIVGLLWRIGR